MASRRRPVSPLTNPVARLDTPCPTHRRLWCPFTHAIHDSAGANLAPKAKSSTKMTVQRRVWGGVRITLGLWGKAAKTGRTGRYLPDARACRRPSRARVWRRVSRQEDAHRAAQSRRRWARSTRDQPTPAYAPRWGMHSTSPIVCELERGLYRAACRGMTINQRGWA